MTRDPLRFKPPHLPACICPACSKARLGPPTGGPGRPRTPEDGQPVATPEQGRPITTRED